MASMRFLGAAGTVTGSRYLVNTPAGAVLVDAGLFQGRKELRLRNWEPFPVPPATLAAVVLTHAHIDHAGALPLLAREGYRGPVHCTPATRDLASLLLPDSGKLQEEEARFANQRGYSKHAPNARPLYTEREAVAALRLLQPLPYGVPREILPGVTLTFRRAGHILGSATVELALAGPGGAARRVLFSGDLGRYGAPILPDPEPAPAADVLLVECTYGDRLHQGDAGAELRQAVLEAVARGGALLVPAFAVGRSQELLFRLRALEAAGEIPELPVFMDSPMAVDATPMYVAHREDHDDEMSRLLAAGVDPLRPARLRFARATEQSKAIHRVEGPCVIISASGMATGGRILHHLEHRLPDERTTVLLAGYQAPGTRGWSLQNGARTLRLHGLDVPVRARVATLTGLSAHGDRDEVARWLDTLPRPPARTYCVHGEPAPLAAVRDRLAARGWSAAVPRHGEEVELG
ncbi:MBL fold metallo-hydrolase RNA specificity domain-containing protein [Anaeromyxobacter diazotrophicus]|uniref:MBL fold metallo-hydrolase n=1 Tax=Anaeromyxobacter diazotrophicus TaxID=2590199 RepID=A0A7I9VPR8_9BACT|nr:MBL fold metallo-hydrolase [Anaeromyxobacter diazotrophicus]GEJ58385.1 MBL fold metallo-hydrolase [Anaeromyxobacter diazotrophicus]